MSLPSSTKAVAHRIGIPAFLLTKNAAQFVNKFSKALCSLLSSSTSEFCSVAPNKRTGQTVQRKCKLPDSAITCLNRSELGALLCSNSHFHTVSSLGAQREVHHSVWCSQDTNFSQKPPTFHHHSHKKETSASLNIKAGLHHRAAVIRQKTEKDLTAAQRRYHDHHNYRFWATGSFKPGQ